MSRSRVVPFYLVVFLIPPLACSAQSESPFATRSAAIPAPSSVTSVHELQIPEKARNAFNKRTRRFAAKDSAGSIPELQRPSKHSQATTKLNAKLGSAELDLEQSGSAESAFRKSIELSGGRYAPANFGLGLILATITRDFAHAEASVRAGLETAPADATCLSRILLVHGSCWLKSIFERGSFLLS